MGLNDTPRADRLHIGLFGKRNSGKSSLINALTGQQLALVSERRERLQIRYLKLWSCILSVRWFL